MLAGGLALALTTVASAPIDAPSATKAAVPPKPRVYVSPVGNDANSCTSVSPCATFQRAYLAARPGDVVEIGEGAYTYQRLELDARKVGRAKVVFRPAPGSTVVVQQIDFGQAQQGVRPAQDVEVRDMAVGYLRAWDGTRDITWRNIRGRTFDVFSETAGVTQDVSVLGGVFGPCEAPREEACTVRLTGRNVLVDGVTIYGVTSTDLVNWHVDGMFIRGCNGCVVRNSKFYAKHGHEHPYPGLLCFASVGEPCP